MFDTDKQWVVLVGKFDRGFAVHGPYEHADQAERFADEVQESTDFCVAVLPLVRPQESRLS